MTASLRFGRIAGIPVGASWSALLIALLIAWSLGGQLLPAEVPGLVPSAYWLAGAAGAAAPPVGAASDHPARPRPQPPPDRPRGPGGALQGPPGRLPLPLRRPEAPAPVRRPVPAAARDLVTPQRRRHPHPQERLPPPGARPGISPPHRPALLRGRLAHIAEDALIEVMTEEGDLAAKELIRCQLEAMRKEIAGKNCSALERLLSERVVLTWLEVQLFEALYAKNMPKLTIAQAEHHQKRLDLAH